MGAPRGIVVPAISMSANADRVGKNCTDDCNRSTSSMAPGINSGLLRSNSIDHGLGSAVRTQCQVKLTVEVWPATNSRIVLFTIALGDIRPSGPSSWTNCEIIPGPGDFLA